MSSSLHSEPGVTTPGKLPGVRSVSRRLPGCLPALRSVRTACRRLPAGRLLAEQAVKRADWWREVRSVAQAAWQAPARLPVQLNAPQVNIS